MDLRVTRAEPTPGLTDDRRLTRTIAVAALILFITLLALFTGDLDMIWPLYLVPVLLAALSHGVSGAILATTVCVGIAALVMPGTDHTAAVRLGMIVGFTTFLAGGVVVGRAASRAERRVRETEQASVFDRETGLLSSSALQESLARELDRSTRHGFDVALVVARVDDLEAFHEQFGAYKAGLLLEHMAEVVSISARGSDIVGRLAPDVFAVVAPFASSAEAAVIATRIDEAIAHASFEGDALEPAAHCRASVAWASFPREAPGLDALVELAAERLATAPGEAPS